MISTLVKPIGAGAKIGPYRILRALDQERGCYLAEEPIGRIEVVVRTVALESSPRRAFLNAIGLLVALVYDTGCKDRAGEFDILGQCRKSRENARH